MKNAMKLTYIIDELATDLAGTENQLIKMINGLSRMGVEINLVCFRNNPWLEKNASTLPCKVVVIEIKRFKRPFTYINYMKLVRFLKSSKPDIVHTFFPTANILGVIAARLAGVDVILSSRRDYGEWMIGRYLRMTRFANRFATKIVANSYKVKELTVEKEGADPSMVEVFLNGIDTAMFANIKRDNTVKERLKIPAGDKVVGIVANFRPMKRHHTFLRAAHEILQKRDTVSFLLIGTGPLKEELQALSNSLGISGKVHFTSSQDNVLPFLSIMDAGVNCSEGEGLSNAVMEYMSAGVPCVVSEAGGNPDLITNGYNGYTFKIDDHCALSSLVLKLLDDEGVRKTFINNARKTIEEKMSLDVVLSKYKSFYEKISNA